jgi:DNA-binding NarL/FixJ family response regulator
MLQATHAASQPLRIILADDHEIVRAGTMALLSRIPEASVVAEARNGEELLAAVESVASDIVITDIRMPGLDGLGAIARIRQRRAAPPVLVLSMYDTLDFVKRAVAMGASGYVMKAAAPTELHEAVRAVAAGGTYYSSAVAQLLLQQGQPAPEEQLTARQVQILVLLAEGMSSKEIAHQLGLSPKTVDVHRARIMERLQLNDVARLTRYAVRMGLVQA